MKFRDLIERKELSESEMKFQALAIAKEVHTQLAELTFIEMLGAMSPDNPAKKEVQELETKINTLTNEVGAFIQKYIPDVADAESNLEEPEDNKEDSKKKKLKEAEEVLELDKLENLSEESIPDKDKYKMTYSRHFGKYIQFIHVNLHVTPEMNKNQTPERIRHLVKNSKIHKELKSKGYDIESYGKFNTTKEAWGVPVKIKELKSIFPVNEELCKELTFKNIIKSN